MKSLTIKQPWAGLVASGRKTIELRTWTTSYRGPLLVIAGKGRSSRDCTAKSMPDFCAIRGSAICVVELDDIRTANTDDAVAACSTPAIGEFAWILHSPIVIEPLEMRGSLGLTRVNPSQFPSQLKQILAYHHLRV